MTSLAHPQQGQPTPLPARLPNMQALRAFEAAARSGSFTRAAEELYLTQSAVTYQIRNLEDYLGTSLFQRLHRGIRLTNAGRAVYNDISRGLALIGESLTSVSGAPGATRAISRRMEDAPDPPSA
ncbi:LysR family transcriptional regulator [Aquisalimonas asiatica]|uniref:Regulatory helix-turn-helix protein, lysR family n=1 Tax=Aquisalimonas asiatica TaxID=406100 RepID=A0A1H8RH45_9GAMM|nr:LysR family transcriptional regulator [Aquisalimonas asiatica]SEO65478.1 regulatory helix-turn-helix protein, lysR family [Aquisalimonas asiatica]